MLDDAQRAQLRRRLRAWTTLAKTTPVLGRSPIRTQILALASAQAVARLAAGDAPRLAVTFGLRAALCHAWAGTDGYRSVAAQTAALIAKTGSTSGDLRAWDAVLTAAELRPSSRLDPLAAHALAKGAQADDLRAPRLEKSLRRRFAGRAPGAYAIRRGATDLDAAIRLFWEVVEPSMFEVLTFDEAEAAAAHAFGNLIEWDRVLERISAGAPSDEAQGTALKFLEPRVMRAYLALPVDEIIRIAARSGKHLRLATLTERQVPTEPATLEARGGEVNPETLAVEAEQWRKLVEGIVEGVRTGVFDAQRVVFLWLSAAVGAGEAWRLAGLPLAQVGSANYHRNQLVEKLANLVGTSASARLPNPGKPTERARALVALLNARAGRDPFVDAQAQVSAPPVLDDDALLDLLVVLNRPGETGTRTPNAAALVADALAALRVDRARRDALGTVLAEVTVSADAGGRISDRDLLFLLATMIIGLPSEGAAQVDAAGGARPARNTLVAWLSAAFNVSAEETAAWLDGRACAARAPAAVNAVLDALARVPTVPAAPPGLKRRPVEREAQLRLHLEAEAHRG